MIIYFGTPHPNPLPQEEGEAPFFSPPLVGEDEGEGA